MMTEHKPTHVLGFGFNERRTQVVLIKKNKPEFLAGLWTGLGGKIEEDDRTSRHAMSREFEEESGVYVPAGRWIDLAVFVGTHGHTVDCFYAFDNRVLRAESMEEEEVKVFNLSDLNTNGNAMWLIYMALDRIKNVPLILY